MAEEKKDEITLYLQDFLDALEADSKEKDVSVVEFPLDVTPHIKKYIEPLISNMDGIWLSEQSLKGSPAVFLELFSTLRTDMPNWENIKKDLEKELFYIYPEKQILTPETIEIQSLEEQEIDLKNKKTQQDIPYNYLIKAKLKEGMEEDLTETLAIEIRNHVLPPQARLDVSHEGKDLDIRFQKLHYATKLIRHLETNQLAKTSQIDIEEIVLSENKEDFYAFATNPKLSQMHGRVDVKEGKAEIVIDVPGRFGDLTPLQTIVKDRTGVHLAVGTSGWKMRSTELDIKDAKEVIHFVNKAIKESSNGKTTELFSKSVSDKLDKAAKSYTDDDVAMTNLVQRKNGEWVAEFSYLGLDDGTDKDFEKLETYATRLFGIGNSLDIGQNAKTKAPILKMTFSHAQHALDKLSELQSRKDAPHINNAKLQEAANAIPDPTHVPFARTKVAYNEGVISITVPNVFQHGEKHANARVEDIYQQLEMLRSYHFHDAYQQSEQNLNLPTTQIKEEGSNAIISLEIPKRLQDKEKSALFKDLKNIRAEHTSIAKTEKREEALKEFGKEHQMIQKAAAAISPTVQSAYDTLGAIKESTSQVVGTIASPFILLNEGRNAFGIKPLTLIGKAIDVTRNKLQDKALDKNSKEKENLNSPETFSQREEEKRHTHTPSCSHTHH